ncbi:MAG: ABC transporter ATP-binding protein [Alphaproteobacteria bacterium]|nr:ABC transporter ATP-binding protein [Alphaproteobacteria bacterium]
MADGGLVLSRLSAGYGETTVLEDIDLALAPGETLAVLGRNGVGKTTLLATIMGHTQLHRGTLRFAGQDVSRLAPQRRARLGLGWVPQERDIFPSLTVEENLTVAPRPGRWSLERVYALFPQLADRRRNMGNQLSGGEQQMLSVGRALMGNPRVLLLDEPLEGLAPVIVDTLLVALRALRTDEGLGLVLVEQHARLALEFAPRAVVLQRGRLVHDGPSAALLDAPARLAELLAIGEAAP